MIGMAFGLLIRGEEGGIPNKTHAEAWLNGLSFAISTITANV